jgi:hypothetical protein
MDFTFGIITSGDNVTQVNKIITSIKNLYVDRYEILIIGGENVYHDEKKVKHHQFNENCEKAWITKKKNIITEKAQYENIVYLHDYVLFDKNWYQGYLNYGNNFEVVTNIILNKDRKRFRDWTLWPHNGDLVDEIIGKDLKCLIPYSISNLSKYMYISGTYWVAKKEVMLEFPLNENLFWGEGEDVEWSKRVRSRYDFKFNKFSTVNLNKQKRNDFKEISKKDLLKILNHTNI